MLSLYTAVIKCESVYSGCIKLNDHIYKVLLERSIDLLLINFSDTYPGMFCGHHNFYNLLMFSHGKNDVTYKLDQ